MRSVRRTTQFKKDVKRAKKRGKDLGKLKAVIELLVRGESLPDRYRDHELVGQFKGVHVPTERRPTAPGMIGPAETSRATAQSSLNR